MSITTAADIVDTAAGLSPHSPVGQLRRERPDFVRLTQASHDAALAPGDPGGISHAERAAIACRVARLARAERLSEHYAAVLAAAGDESFAAVADPALKPPEGGRLAAMVRHVDLLAIDPGRATRADIEALHAAGLTDRDIVALAGLVAFVSYQIRVVAGLRMWEGA